MSNKLTYTTKSGVTITAEVSDLAAVVLLRSLEQQAAKNMGEKPNVRRIVRKKDALYSHLVRILIKLRLKVRGYSGLVKKLGKLSKKQHMLLVLFLSGLTIREIAILEGESEIVITAKLFEILFRL
jgi:hypothetical protein